MERVIFQIRIEKDQIRIEGVLGSQGRKTRLKNYCELLQFIVNTCDCKECVNKSNHPIQTTLLLVTTINRDILKKSIPFHSFPKFNILILSQVPKIHHSTFLQVADI
jgi:hypothetical protein